MGGDRETIQKGDALGKKGFQGVIPTSSLVGAK